MQAKRCPGKAGLPQLHKSNPFMSRRTAFKQVCSGSLMICCCRILAGTGMFLVGYILWGLRVCQVSAAM